VAIIDVEFLIVFSVQILEALQNACFSCKIMDMADSNSDVGDIFFR